MPTSKWLELALAYHESLNENLPALVDEVNQMLVGFAYPIVMPALDIEGDSIELDVDPGLINGTFVDFPRAQCGVFSRTGLSELSEPVDEMAFPYTFEIYIAARTKKAVFVQGIKWGIVLDLFFERYGPTIHPNFRTKPSTDADMTFSLPNGKGTSTFYTKLISATGQFETYE